MSVFATDIVLLGPPITVVVFAGKDNSIAFDIGVYGQVAAGDLANFGAVEQEYLPPISHPAFPDDVIAADVRLEIVTRICNLCSGISGDAVQNNLP